MAWMKGVDETFCKACLQKLVLIVAQMIPLMLSMAPRRRMLSKNNFKEKESKVGKDGTN